MPDGCPQKLAGTSTFGLRATVAQTSGSNPVGFVEVRGQAQWGRILFLVSARLDPSWSVLASPSTPAVDRCVDVFVRPDGTYGFEEFRRDPEDMGAWTPVAYYSTREFETEDDAVSAARDAVPWLSGVLDGRS